MYRLATKQLWKIMPFGKSFVITFRLLISVYSKQPQVPDFDHRRGVHSRLPLQTPRVTMHANFGRCRHHRRNLRCWRLLQQPDTQIQRSWKTVTGHTFILWHDVLESSAQCNIAGTPGHRLCRRQGKYEDRLPEGWIKELCEDVWTGYCYRGSYSGQGVCCCVPRRYDLCSKWADVPKYCRPRIYCKCALWKHFGYLGTDHCKFVKIFFLEKYCCATLELKQYYVGQCKKIRCNEYTSNVYFSLPIEILVTMTSHYSNGLSTINYCNLICSSTYIVRHLPRYMLSLQLTS